MGNLRTPIYIIVVVYLHISYKTCRIR